MTSHAGAPEESALTLRALAHTQEDDVGCGPHFRVEDDKLRCGGSSWSTARCGPRAQEDNKPRCPGATAAFAHYGVTVCTPVAMVCWSILCIVDLSSIWWPPGLGAAEDGDRWWSRGIALATLVLAFATLAVDWLRLRGCGGGNALRQVATVDPMCSQMPESPKAHPALQARRRSPGDMAGCSCWAGVITHGALLGGSTSWLGFHAAIGREPQVWAGAAAFCILVSLAGMAAVSLVATSRQWSRVHCTSPSTARPTNDSNGVEPRTASSLPGQSSCGRWRPLFVDPTFSWEDEARKQFRQELQVTQNAQVSTTRSSGSFGSSSSGLGSYCSGAESPRSPFSATTTTTPFTRPSARKPTVDFRAPLSESTRSVESRGQSQHLTAGAVSEVVSMPTLSDEATSSAFSDVSMPDDSRCEQGVHFQKSGGHDCRVDSGSSPQLSDASFIVSDGASAGAETTHRQLERSESGSALSSISE